jgi:transposase
MTGPSGMLRIEAAVLLRPPYSPSGRTLDAEGSCPLSRGRARWTLLKRPEDRTASQETKLAKLVRTTSARFVHTCCARDRWCTKVMRSRVEPMKQIARSLRSHRALILNWFEARGGVSLGATEGMNDKLKVITRRAFGLRTHNAMAIALCHAHGDLPDPTDEFTHRSR